MIVNKTEEKIRQRTKDLENIKTGSQSQNAETEELVKDELHMLLEQEDLKWPKEQKKIGYNLVIGIPSFFHMSNNQRSRRNKIAQIQDGQGHKFNKISQTQQEIENAFIS